MKSHVLSWGYTVNKLLLLLLLLYSVLEGQEQLKEQLEVMFKKRTLNWEDRCLAKI